MFQLPADAHYKRECVLTKLRWVAFPEYRLLYLEVKSSYSCVIFWFLCRRPLQPLMVISDCRQARLDQSVSQGIAVLGQKCSCGMKKFRTCLALSLMLNLVSWLGPYIFYNVNTTRLSHSERYEGIDLQAYLAGNLNNQNKCNHLSEIRTADGWFEDNFRPSLKPMWTPRRENISREVFTWWNVSRQTN